MCLSTIILLRVNGGRYATLWLERRHFAPLLSAIKPQAINNRLKYAPNGDSLRSSGFRPFFEEDYIADDDDNDAGTNTFCSHTCKYSQHIAHNSLIQNISHTNSIASPSAVNSPVFITHFNTTSYVQTQVMLRNDSLNSTY